MTQGSCMYHPPQGQREAESARPQRIKKKNEAGETEIWSSTSLFQPLK